MTWRKYFTPVSTTKSNLSVISGTNSISKPGPAKTNYSSYLPDVYSGSPNRIDRYQQYEVMDSDPEINAALDILAEFCTQKLKDGKSPFTVKWRHKATNSEVRILAEYLQQWNKLQQFDTRIFRIVRNTFKYGDSFFIRDPETQKWHWIDPSKIVKIIVNESDGKAPEQYVVKDLAPNFENLVVTQITPNINPRQTGGGITSSPGYFGATGMQRGTSGPYPSASSGSRFGLSETEYAIDSEHMVHLSLSEGLDNNYPFGNSLLENIFKVYKQKELLEDAILIYRIQRAPERRVFHIDVGNMPSHMAMAFVERVKNEIHQRRIPSQSGGGNIIDSAYNPLSVNEDYYFPKTESGRGSDVTTLPGGCFAMDTKVSLLDGRELSISEIAEEMKAGQELWTYSCNPLTGEIVPGLISWAGVTQASAKVMKITLDNDEFFICTPEHKLVSRNEGFKRADEMIIGDSLMPLYRQRKILYNNADYEQTFDNSKKKWRNTHRIVAEYLKHKKVLIEIYDSKLGAKNHQVVHHKNFNRLNNDPNNLCFMNQKDHFKYHSDNSGKKMLMLKETNIAEYNRICQMRSKSAQKFWNSLSIEEKQKFSLKIKESIKRLSKEEKEARDQRCRDAFKKGNQVFNEMMNSNPEFYNAVVSKRMKYWTEENRKIRSENTRKHNYKNWSGDKGQIRREKHIKLQSVEYTHDMLLAIIDLIKGKSSHEANVNFIVTTLNNNQEMLAKLTKLNQNKKIRNWNVERGFTESGIKTMVKQFGYKNWHDFRVKESIHNHRITKIEYLDDPIEVGTLTIDQDEIYHNYHTFALSAGVMVKNSNLGEIDDLRFFTNKLFRGLRIPSSYLPTGAEDSQTAFNDGRVGTAYIQELRFNKYCERLQSLITEVFDLEFKMYMYTRGLNIDSNLFELQFNPPMNFASTRQATIDAERINTFNTIQAIPFMSNRFALKRFLGLTDEELAENERLWAEENGQGQPTYTDAAGELRGAGLSVAGIEGDLGMAGDLSAPEDITGEGELGGELGMGAAPPIAPATPGAPPPM